MVVVRGVLLDHNQKLQFARGCWKKVCVAAHRNVTNKKQREREGGSFVLAVKKKTRHHQHVVCGVTPPKPHTHNSIGTLSPHKKRGKNKNR